MGEYEQFIIIFGGVGRVGVIVSAAGVAETQSLPNEVYTHHHKSYQCMRYMLVFDSGRFDKNSRFYEGWGYII